MRSDLAGGGPAIVLSTFNGARFLREQIASIQAQTVGGWHLFIRDDGSTDGTVELLTAVARGDRRIELIPGAGRNVGPVASFGLLLELARERGARYVFLADQDDVWVPDKVERQLATLAAVESEIGADRPVLAHSDLAVVDENLCVIHPSFRVYQGFVERATLRVLLAQNVVVGCTAAVNRALLDLALPMPTAVMHDWWLAQCAAAAGTVAHDPVPTVLYRQHSANVIGATGLWQRFATLLREPRRWWKRGARNFVGGVRQAAELARRLEPVAGDASAGLLTAYDAAFTARASSLQRLRAIRQLGVGPGSAAVRYLFYLRVLLYSRLSPAR